ncbi:SCO2322 family protein [Kitasatospora indigofera]|uniref:SCO2322 family protein n=3 Tax=Kitasatospora indigofera TaxID=67307 RepID=UPI00363E6937
MTRRAHPRAVAATLAATALLGLLGVLAAAPAHATGYRYWSFWKWSGGAWAYQQQGPAGYVPPDGSVDGWRFAVSPDGGRDAARPGAPGDFEAACAATPAQAGRKRIAVVLDFGTAADAPPGALAAGSAPPAARTGCASVPTGASSAEVLAALAPPLRYDGAGILCAIAGYPAAGCGEALAGTAPAPGGPDGSDGSAGPDLGLIAGGAAVAVLTAGAVWQARRRR